ncbi:MAG: OmpA family protein [Flavobacteriales bacterium]
MNISKLVAGALLSTTLMLMPYELDAQTKRTKKADIAFDLGEYHKASERYKNAYGRANDKTEKQYISFKMAECARRLGNYRQAENYLKRTVKMRYEDPIAILYLAEAQANLGKYDLALENYNAYQNLVPGDKRAEKGIENSMFALKQMDNQTLYELANQKRFNSRGMDYSPAFAKKDYSVLLFTTTREAVTGSRISDQTGQPFADIWGTKIEKKKRRSSSRNKSKKPQAPKWERAVSLGAMGTGDAEETINTKHEEGTVSLTPKANMMYYTQGVYEKDVYDGQRIFVSKRKGGGWEEGTQLNIPVNQGEDMFIDLMHPAIHPNERTLYFVANLEGGYGGMDIWSTEFDKRKKKWTKPKNLGPEINTRGNEGFPTVHVDGTLFFSSTGHQTLGGYDIYRSQADEDGIFATPTNMGYPINSSYDDFGMAFKGNTYAEGFMTSNRKGGMGMDDIYSFKLLNTYFNFKGQLIDGETNKPIKNLKIRLEGSDGSIHETVTDAEGNYEFKPEHLSRDVDYNLAYMSEDYGKFTHQFSTKGFKVGDFERGEEGYEYDFTLDTALVVQRLPVVLPHIEYDFGQSTLRPEARIDLDHLARVLESNTQLRIKLRSHTDHIGGTEANNVLSQARAQACVDYLISKGIAADRLEAEGRGEAEPYTMMTQDGELNAGQVLTEAYINTLSKANQEKARQYNRRTDFKQLKPDPNETPEAKRAQKFGKY